MEKASTFIFFLIIVLIASLVSFLASRRGRNPVAWFFAGLFFGWISLIFLYLLPSQALDQDEEGGKREEKSYKNDEDFSLSQGAKEPVVTIEQAPISEKKLYGWYYLDKAGKQQGPVDLQALKELFHTDKIHVTAYVWHEGIAEWKKVTELPWLKTELGID